MLLPKNTWVYACFVKTSHGCRGLSAQGPGDIAERKALHCFCFNTSLAPIRLLNNNVFGRKSEFLAWPCHVLYVTQPQNR